MNAEIVKQMRSEEADLVRKLQAVRDFLAAYGEKPIGNDSAVKASNVRPSRTIREKVDISSFTAQTRRSVLLALEKMAHTDGLTKTKELVDYIESRGHEVSGKNKVNSLGALLARSLDVEGHGKSGWDVVDRDRALQLLTKYEYNEKEPTSEDAGGSETGWGGAATPNTPWTKPSDQSA